MNKISSKADFLKQQLLYEISTGVYREGDRLCCERELSLKHDISRNTVRLAIDRLTAEGILERRPRSGAYISRHAMELIARDNRRTALKVTFVFPPYQMGNALFMTMFQTCCANLEPEIKVELKPHWLDSTDWGRDFGCDVLVSFSCLDFELMKKLRDRHRFFILVNDENPDFNYIALDNLKGGEMMADYLIGCGHRKVGGLGYDRLVQSSDFRNRMLGMARRLAAAGVEFHQTSISFDDFFRVEPHCFQALSLLRRRCPEITGMLCCCDMTALGVLLACEQMDIRVPEDMSVVGFDDQLCARFLKPALSTVKYPAEAIGIRLAGYFNGILAGRESPLQELVTPLLIRRDSVMKR